jgi:hypothetical protein
MSVSITFIMLIVIMPKICVLIVIMLNVITLIVITRNVVAPLGYAAASAFAAWVNFYYLLAEVPGIARDQM